MANKRPEHRRGTTGRDYRRLQAQVFAGPQVCARCGNSRGPILRIACDHPSHAKLDYCPTHRLAPSLGHKQDLQHGGRTSKANSQLEHFGCNASAGVKARMNAQHARRTQTQSWDW